jgi:osmotically-inducible protein OsmY
MNNQSKFIISCIIEDIELFVQYLNGEILLLDENPTEFISSSFACEVAASLNNVYSVANQLKVENIKVQYADIV